MTNIQPTTDTIDELLHKYITYSDGFNAYIIEEEDMHKFTQAIKSLLNDFAERITPDSIRDTQPEIDDDYDQGKHDGTIYGHNNCVGQVQANTKKELGL